MERSSTPEPLKEHRKRLRERVLIALTLILVVALTSLEVHLVSQGGQPVTGSLVAFGLLNLNTILLLFITFLIFRHLTKLFMERRRKVFGSRLRTRLVLTFITLTLLPTLFLFFMAWQLISLRADYSLDRQVEESLDRTLDLSRSYSREIADSLQAHGQLFSLKLSEKRTLNDRAALESFLSQQRQEHQLTAVEFLDPTGVLLAESHEPKMAHLPRVSFKVPGPEAVPEGEVLRQQTSQGELLSFLGPIKNESGALTGYVVVRQIIPRSHFLQIAEGERSLQELRQRQLLFSPVKVTHYFTLAIVTLIAIMSAIWLGFYMAREITIPIRQLAEGTLKVAGGDYDVQIDQEGRDEIGFLVQSFNKMTQDLQQSQTQLAAAYQQLSENHALISAQKRNMEILLKNVAAGVISLDGQGRVTTINDSAAQTLRLKREAVLGQDCRVLVPPEEYNRLAEVVAAARKSSRGTVEKPLHLLLPDQTLYLLVKPTVLKDETGQDLGVVIVFEDLTELERAQRLAAWREVARRIAHEVKNPLTPIKLAAQRLRRRYQGGLGDDGQIIDECTQIIEKQVDDLKNLVNEFSRFARLPQLTLAPQDLNALIQETLLLYQEGQPRINLEFQPAPHLPPLLLDREQVKRALLNLLDNALASIRGAGRITLSLRGNPLTNRVEITVADTGTGVPERDKVRIFEPYFSTKRGGTGLGLAIVHSIVAEHQGYIRVEDNRPRGARFIIELPMHRVAYVGNHSGSG